MDKDVKSTLKLLPTKGRPIKVPRKKSSAEEGMPARLKRAVADQGIPDHGSGRYLAELVEVSATTTGQWLSGNMTPARYRVEQIAKKLGVSLAWLELGVTASETIDGTVLRECILGMQEAQETSKKLGADEYAQKLVDVYTICVGKEIPAEQARNMAMIYAMA